MKAATVQSFDRPPRYRDFAEPSPLGSETLVTVHAAALSPLVKGQASGRHYAGASTLPLIPGVDVVGTLPDGRRVYFAFPKPPRGAMAEIVAVRTALTVPVPKDIRGIQSGLSQITVRGDRY
jgi:NADPH:quinone reductase-like Zn-dependent oxidoreductase